MKRYCPTPVELTNAFSVLFPVLFFVLIFGCFGFLDLGAEPREPREIKQKVITAVRVTEPVKIDGILEETPWQTRGCEDFVQLMPDDGAAPTERTAVWVAYDEKYLYIAARCFDSEPGKISALLARKDGNAESDWFWLDIDPYYDRRTGYRFAVNPSSTLGDGTLYNDEEYDEVWDGVWTARARIDKQGWTLEMKIPFNQLRFKKQDKFTWGINFRRVIRRKNEEQGLVWIPRDESGFVSRFARLEGIKNIHPGRNIELIPYTVGRAEFGPEEEGNPFETGRQWSGNLGLDLKWGIKSNLILDATINPDFGEVELDPAVITLDAGEIYYDEKRPFFIEGSSTFDFGYGGVNEVRKFDWGDPDFFYSRRIGQPPQVPKYPDHENMYVDHPGYTTILGAAKLTGKLGRGWNIGLLSAVTAREYAEIDDSGASDREAVEPLSYYNIVRVQKEFNSGRQGLGILATSVNRDLDTPRLEESLVESAYALAVDGWTTLDKNNTWALSGWLGGTWLHGSPDSITRIKHSFPHYYQRPDAEHLSKDAGETRLNGWAGRLVLNKQKGNFAFNAAVGAISPGFHSADMGFQNTADTINAHISAGYKSYRPGKLFRNWSLVAATHRTYDFDGTNLGSAYYIDARGQFLNYWGGLAMYIYYPDQFNKELTRGGPLLKTPSFSWFSTYLYTDSRKPVVVTFTGNYQKGRNDLVWYALELRGRVKVRSNLSFSIAPHYESYKTDLQWVTKRKDALMTATYGTRYIFSNIEVKELSAELRLDWTFSPKLTLQAYLQPYIYAAAYSGFKELARPGSFEFNRYGGADAPVTDYGDIYQIDPDGPGPANPFLLAKPDFNYVSLRGTVVLRWEFKPRSTFYLVWTQNREDFTADRDLKFRRDFRRLFDVEGYNIFMMKFTYRFQL